MDLVLDQDQYLYDCWLFHRHVNVPKNYIKKCWIWQGPKHVNGYGRISVRGQRWYAHRLSWHIHHNKPIGKGQVIRHLCNQPLCVNPHHLRSGTQKQNMLDMHLAGRQGYVRKLNPQQITDIRASTKTQAELARQYGVSRTTIHRVLKIAPKHK